MNQDLDTKLTDTMKHPLPQVSGTMATHEAQPHHQLDLFHTTKSHPASRASRVMALIESAKVKIAKATTPKQSITWRPLCPRGPGKKQKRPLTLARWVGQAVSSRKKEEA